MHALYIVKSREGWHKTLHLNAAAHWTQTTRKGDVHVNVWAKSVGSCFCPLSHIYLIMNTAALTSKSWAMLNIYSSLITAEKKTEEWKREEGGGGGGGGGQTDGKSLTDGQRLMERERSNTWNVQSFIYQCLKQFCKGCDSCRDKRLTGKYQTGPLCNPGAICCTVLHALASC